MASTVAAPATPLQQRRAAAQRLVSLDIFRGLTIAGMILVNNPGTWSAVYAPLRHAEWHGCTPTDLVFPFFLFTVGVSMVLSFEKRRQRGDRRRALLRHVLVRSVVIFAVGLFLAGFPHFDFSRIRIPGVLQRIAVVYLFSSVLVLCFGRKARWAWIAGLLGGYWLLMTRVPVPGYGAGNLSPDGNLAAFIDRKLMLYHLWVRDAGGAGRWDPEGLLSTLPAIATCLLGVVAGEWLNSPGAPRVKVRGLLAGGAAAMAAGRLWGLWFPINKGLWTSSYVLFTAGSAMVVLAACYWLVEIKETRTWGRPFLWLGMNPLAIFALSTFVAKCTLVYKTTLADGRSVSWQAYLYRTGFAPLAAPVNASLLWALAYVAVFTLLAWIMYRNTIFLRI